MVELRIECNRRHAVFRFTPKEEVCKEDGKCAGILDDQSGPIVDVAGRFLFIRQR